MQSVNTKRIEESATTALKAALLRCPVLDSYINSNDKTPSWDGEVHVYKSEKIEKSNFVGRVPIQIKGTTNQIVSDTATFPCCVVDLKNYYNDGGCVFFYISVDLDSGDSKIFYKILLVDYLQTIINDAGKQNTYTINLNRFPTESNKITSIFMQVIDDVRYRRGSIPRKIIRQKKYQDINLKKINTGQELLAIGDGAYALEYSYDEPRTREEAEVISDITELLNNVIDYIDVYNTDERIMFAFELNDQIIDLEKSGFWLFLAIEERLLTGDNKPAEIFPTLLARIVRKGNPGIIKISEEHH